MFLFLRAVEPVTIVASADFWSCARAVHASFLADRLAVIFRRVQQSVAIVTAAAFRRDAFTLHARFTADRFADVLLVRSIARITGANVRSGACTEQTVLYAFRYTSDPVVHVAGVADARVRRDAFTVLARFVADWYTSGDRVIRIGQLIA